MARTELGDGESAYVRPPTMQSAVLTELRRQLSSGELRPGESLRTEALAESFGVSRVPVREALRVLEGENQIEHVPHRGYRVSELSLTDFHEMMRMRNLLENDALLETVPMLGNLEFGLMRKSLLRMEEANDDDDVLAHTRANADFHKAFFDPLPWPRMLRQLELLYQWVTPYCAMFFNEPENRAATAVDHEGLMALAEKHDAEGVIRALGEHRERISSTLTRILSP